jgi:hypothetical protein
LAQPSTTPPPPLDAAAGFGASLSDQTTVLLAMLPTFEAGTRAGTVAPPSPLSPFSPFPVTAAPPPPPPRTPINAPTAPDIEEEEPDGYLYVGEKSSIGNGVDEDGPGAPGQDQEEGREIHAAGEFALGGKSCAGRTRDSEASLLNALQMLDDLVEVEGSQDATHTAARGSATGEVPSGPSDASIAAAVAAASAGGADSTQEMVENITLEPPIHPAVVAENVELKGQVAPAPKCEHLCEEGEEQDATHHCNECDSFFCDSCNTLHAKPKNTRNHAVQTAAEFAALLPAATAAPTMVGTPCIHLHPHRWARCSSLSCSQCPLATNLRPHRRSARAHRACNGTSATETVPKFTPSPPIPTSAKGPAQQHNCDDGASRFRVHTLYGPLIG